MSSLIQNRVARIFCKAELWQSFIHEVDMKHQTDCLHDILKTMFREGRRDEYIEVVRGLARRSGLVASMSRAFSRLYLRLQLCLSWKRVRGA